jgi:hypothetical protein
MLKISFAVSMVDHLSIGLQELRYCKSEYHIIGPSRRVEHDSLQMVRDGGLCLGEFLCL